MSKSRYFQAKIWQYLVIFCPLQEQVETGKNFDIGRDQDLIFWWFFTLHCLRIDIYQTFTMFDTNASTYRIIHGAKTIASDWGSILFSSLLPATEARWKNIHAIVSDDGSLLLLIIVWCLSHLSSVTYKN